LFLIIVFLENKKYPFTYESSQVSLTPIVEVSDLCKNIGRCHYFLGPIYNWQLLLDTNNKQTKTRFSTFKYVGKI
jgi:hypothetical protein